MNIEHVREDTQKSVFLVVEPLNPLDHKEKIFFFTKGKNGQKKVTGGVPRSIGSSITTLHSCLYETLFNVTLVFKDFLRSAFFLSFSNTTLFGSLLIPSNCKITKGSYKHCEVFFFSI